MFPSTAISLVSSEGYHMLFLCREWLGDWRDKCNGKEGDVEEIHAWGSLFMASILEDFEQ
jgi:hypothetical protein